ncbi:hypothetical protein SAMN05661012_02109 [Chitinophaga sancti]|uniref:Uncharacterized protein n=1 Tax=Chitinophaga sancti TaxID=1004 RepID=A0A1K1PMQ1_9BACT|nr:hypothetical protein SAMN05661012_02109 [Chitinophaga sancti]
MVANQDFHFLVFPVFAVMQDNTLPCVVRSLPQENYKEHNDILPSAGDMLSIFRKAFRFHPGKEVLQETRQ